MNYSLRFSRKSRNHIRRLDHGTRQRILERIDALRTDPFNPSFSEPMAARPGVRKSRVGDWRVIYEVSRETAQVDILVVQPRGQVYKRV